MTPSPNDVRHRTIRARHPSVWPGRMVELDGETWIVEHVDHDPETVWHVELLNDAYPETVIATLRPATREEVDRALAAFERGWNDQAERMAQREQERVAPGPRSGWFERLTPTLLVMVAHGLDLLVTLQLIALLGGAAGETNPIARAAHDVAGAGGLVGLKLGGTLAMLRLLRPDVPRAGLRLAIAAGSGIALAAVGVLSWTVIS